VTQPRDSCPSDRTDDATAISLEWSRKATPGERAALAISLSTAVITRSRNEIRCLHPDFTEEELGVKFVELHYGTELAAEVAAFQAQRRRNKGEGQ
jgi:hypothetical protein